MSFKINYSNVTNADDAFRKVKTLITPEYIEKFQVTADVSYDEAQKKVKAKGTGFTLELSFFPEHCNVDLDLSFLLRPLKSKIIEKIEGQIKKNL